MKYREKIREVEAFQWSGQNMPTISAFVSPRSVWMNHGGQLLIEAPGAPYSLDLFDWIAKENGELYPVPRDVFARVYEESP